ncbi:MAG: cobyrinate a,c-diamide synthase [Desulfuromusa sp.]|nr:cobyrinate a,c-diamide synthase [Desulfuromusa sp.]
MALNSVGYNRPRILIAGMHSGVGKSSITLALVAALRRRGLKVQTFKVGPDYLDPGHLAQVSGRPCYNLDGWMMTKNDVLQLFCRVSASADISLIEGVMGLFDGSSSESLCGSSAEIATWLHVPVALVVNSHGMARSIAALVKGYHEFEPQVKVTGVIANRCGSASHVDLLEKALASGGQPPLVGAVRRDSLPPLASRHLGLVSAPEQPLAEELVNQLADVAENQIDLDLFLNQARAARSLRWEDSSLPAKNPVQAEPPMLCRLAVAKDEAFLFYYADFFNLLKSLHCEPVFFSPLRDGALPVDVDGLYLGGGYPEVYAKQLAENVSMLRSVANFCQSGRPVYAECGGLIYLTRGIEQPQQKIPLVGVLPVWTRMLEKRKALGYVEVTLEKDSLFGGRGEVFRGHEFHYSELVESPAGKDGWKTVYQLKQNRSGTYHIEGYQKGNILASYVHLYLACRSKAVIRFMACMRTTSDRDSSE